MLVLLISKYIRDSTTKCAENMQKCNTKYSKYLRKNHAAHIYERKILSDVFLLNLDTNLDSTVPNCKEVRM